MALTFLNIKQTMDANLGRVPHIAAFRYAVIEINNNLRILEMEDVIRGFATDGILPIPAEIAELIQVREVNGRVLYPAHRTEPSLENAGCMDAPPRYIVRTGHLEILPHTNNEYEVLFYRAYPALENDNDPIPANLESLYTYQSMAEHFKILRNFRDAEQFKVEAGRILAGLNRASAMKKGSGGQSRVAPQRRGKLRV